MVLQEHKHFLEWNRDTALQAPLSFLVLFLPYLPVHSHPVIAMVIWSCLPSVSGRNSNSSMAPTRFFILYPTHSKAETRVWEIAQQGHTLLTVRFIRNYFGNLDRFFFLSKTLSKSVHYLERGMEPTWSFWVCVIWGKPSRRLFCSRPDLAVTAAALHGSIFLIQSSKLSFPSLAAYQIFFSCLVIRGYTVS